MLGFLRALRNCWSSSDGIVGAGGWSGIAGMPRGKLRETVSAKTLEVHVLSGKNACHPR